MVEAVSYSMVTLMLATGDIKKYQILVGGCQLLNFPLAWVVLAMGCGPEYTVVVSIVVATACMILRLYMLKSMVDFPVNQFLKDVYLNVWGVLLAALPLPIAIRFLLESGLFRFLIVCIIAVLTTALSILFIGCNHRERLMFLSKAQAILKRMKQ